MRRVLSLLLLLVLAGAVSAAAPATEPRSVTATVVGVVTGDTLDVRLPSGKRERVRVAGVRAPAAGACYAAEAAAETSRLVSGQRVVLVGERGGGAYVTVAGGGDLGRLLLERGLAHVDVWNRLFARFAAYVPLQRRAEAANAGMWGACAADVAVALKATPNPVAVGGRLTYAVTVTNRGPLAAPRVDLELRPPAGVELVSSESPDLDCATHAWFAGCTFRSLGAHASVTARFAAEVTEAGAVSTRAVVRLPGCIRAACAQAPLHDSDLRNDETAALTTVRSAETPSSPPPPGAPPSGGCHPSYPDSCIPPPPPDLDCADIPFRDFYVRRDLPDSDPHALDGNEDGVGCQFDDY